MLHSKLGIKRMLRNLPKVKERGQGSVVVTLGSRKRLRSNRLSEVGAGIVEQDDSLVLSTTAASWAVGPAMLPAIMLTTPDGISNELMPRHSA